MSQVGVLLMSYGSPESQDGVEAYLAHIQRGRRPSEEGVADLKRRYARIGGRSPLLEITRRQAAALERELGSPYRVYVGMRHAPPFIAETVSRMDADGVEEAVGLALAPHASRLSSDAYRQAAEDAVALATGARAGERRLRMRFVESFHLAPGLVRALAENVAAALRDRFAPGERERALVLFTAHSLPVRIREWDDPYPRQVLETAAAVAERAGLGSAEAGRWRFAFQSAGHTPEPWLGPDVLDALAEVALESPGRPVLVCPVGFVADHLEVLYDVDVECRERAAALGLELERTPSLNDDPLFIEALAAAVHESLSLSPRGGPEPAARRAAAGEAGCRARMRARGREGRGEGPPGT